MANDNDKRSGVFKSLMDRINQSMNSTYSATYFSQPTAMNNLRSLRDKIDDNIDRIVSNNMDTIGVPSVSKLYSRMLDKDSITRSPNGNISTFDDALTYDDFYATFQNNRYLLEMDAEIDSTCKYFPDLEETILIMREGVLSPDYFSKDFLTLSATRGSTQSSELFDERSKELKAKYNLLSFVNDIFYETSKYGETFVYVVPYSTALTRLLKDKPNTTTYNRFALSRGTHESADVLYTETEQVSHPQTEEFMLNVTESSFTIKNAKNKEIVQSDSKPTMYTEATSLGRTMKEGISSRGDKSIPMMEQQVSSSSILNNNESFNLKVELSFNGIITDAVNRARLTHERQHFMESVSGEFNRTVIREDKNLKIVKKDNTSGKLVIDGMEDELSSDGLVGMNNRKKDNPDDDSTKVSVPGCVMSKVKREQVIPIYIGENNTCLGYYYIEMRSYEELADFRGLNYIMSDSLTSLRGSNSGMNAPFNCIDPSRQEELLKYVASQLSTFIDKNFINANQDLREEIYAILKYNDLFNTPAIDKMKITFIPPEDIVHIYFKLDPNTHRGISDLDRAMVPAKIYASMYITDAIGQLVRGQDKRVFYVRQSVDSNIAQVLMNTINQVKKGNFGFRQFSNINNVLNITGKFNDYFIPVSASGDSPIDIQVLPGQQFTDNSDRMQQIREMAINSTDVPFEIIQMRQSVDYAMQLSMSNSKFLRKIYAKQTVFAPYLSRIVTKLYNFEYHETEEVTVTLPPPVFINTANTNQMVDNTKQYVQNIAEIDMANEEDDKIKNQYIKDLFYYYIGTHIDISRHEEILRRSMQKVAAEANKEEGSGY